ncbi:MAG: autotransporter-associated beta strand repeat-containing protein [Verrucomicrobia bacterium]|nr:autotransporter-associated beta strand repeat-containing protein [Verrucomicrobiota bacterium]
MLTTTGEHWRYARVTNATLTGYVATLWTNALGGDFWGGFQTPTSPDVNYELANFANQFHARLSLKSDAFANTLTIWTNYNGNIGSRDVDLGSEGDNDLTINGLGSGVPVRGTLGWTIFRTETSTGKLIIGDANDLVLSTCWYDISVPIVDNTNGVPGKLTITTPHYVTLSGASTYSGGTDFSPGWGSSLNINSGGALGTGPLWINGSGVSGSPAVIDNSSGAPVTLSNNNAQAWNADFVFAGSTNLNMGTGPVSLGTSPGPVRTVNVGAAVFTVGAITNGTHPHLPTTALVKTGAGTLELTGAGTYTGTTTVRAGTLTLGPDATLTSSELIMAAGAALHLKGSESLPEDVRIDLHGMLQLDTHVYVRRGALWIDGVRIRDGAYGSSASPVAYADDTYFAGIGVLHVGLAKGMIFNIR